MPACFSWVLDKLILKFNKNMAYRCIRSLWRKKSCEWRVVHATMLSVGNIAVTFSNKPMRQYRNSRNVPKYIWEFSIG